MWCSGVGRAAGWTYPMSMLIDKGGMDIVECNVPVKSAEKFFGAGMCAPDALARYYNPFGESTDEASFTDCCRCPCCDKIVLSRATQ